MKKKFWPAIILAAVLGITGCSGAAGSSISNENLEISQYKGLTILDQHPAEVTDETVESQMAYVIQSHRVEQDITDRAASYDSGDWVTIDYAGVIDGVAFDGGTRADADVQLGSGKMIPGFEEAIDGHAVGEQFEFDLAFPDPYPMDESKSGVTAHWVITLKRIYQMTIPEMNDAFVKDTLALDGIETVDQYRAYVREQLENAGERQAEYSMQNEVFEAVYDKTTLKTYPEDEVKKYEDDMREIYQGYADEAGLSLEEYVNSMGMSMDAFNEQLTSTAKSRVTQELIFKAIAEKESLSVDDAYYEENKGAFADKFGFESVSDMETRYDKGEIIDAMQQERILSYLVENANKVETLEEETEESGQKNHLYLLLALAALVILILAVTVLMLLKRTSQDRKEKLAQVAAKREEERTELKKTEEIEEPVQPLTEEELQEVIETRAPKEKPVLGSAENAGIDDEHEVFRLDGEDANLL